MQSSPLRPSIGLIMEAALSSGDVDAVRRLLSNVKSDNKLPSADQSDAHSPPAAKPKEEAAAVEAARAHAKASSQRVRAAELAKQAKWMMQEAKDAEDAAKASQAEAEKRSLATHYHSGSATQSDAYPIGSGDGDLVVKLCAKLAITTEAVRTLTHLKADRLTLGVDGARGLALLLAAGSMQQLESLSLVCNALGELGTATLADAFSHASPLQQLDLASNSVGDVGTVALACALERGALPALAKLCLRNNDIGDEGAAGLARVAHGQLEWLNLSGNQIAEKGTAAIAAALLKGRFPRLRRLSLDHDRLGDGAMHSLASALELGGTTLDELSSSARWTELYVECNPASEAATRRVQEHFDDVGGEAQRPPPAHGGTCARISISLHQNGCVCQ